MVTLHSLALAAGLLSSAPQVELLEFTAPWCQSCQAMQPTINRLKSAGFPIRQVDVDQQKTLAGQHRITRVPAFILLVNGQPTRRIERPATYNELVQLLRPYCVGQNGVEQAATSQTVPFNTTVRGQSPAVQTPPVPGGAVQSRLNELTNGASPIGSATQTTPVSTPIAQTNLQSSSRAEDQALKATVRLRVEDARGFSYATGTIIDKHNAEALVITCGHVFRESQGKGRVTVDLFGNGAPSTVDGQVIAFDSEDRDIGLVVIKPTQPITVARVATAGVQRSEAVFSIGCDRGQAPTVRASKVTNLNRYLGAPNIQVAGHPVIGRSGGGLFNSRGELVGICNAADERDNEGIFAGLPSIHWQLDQLGLQRVYTKSNVAIASAQSLATNGSSLAAKGADTTLRQAPVAPKGGISGSLTPTNGAPLLSAPTEPGISPTDINATPAITPNATKTITTENIEVIVISRSPQGSRSNVQVLSRPSADLLRMIQQEAARSN